MDTPFLVEWLGRTKVAHEQVATARNVCLTKGLGTLTKGLETLGQRHVHHLTSGVGWPRITAGLGTLTKGLETLGQRHVHHLTSGVGWPRITAGLGTLTKGLETLGQRHVHHLTSGVGWHRITAARVGPDRISIWSLRRKPDGISRNRPLLEQANATSVVAT